MVVHESSRGGNHDSVNVHNVAVVDLDIPDADCELCSLQAAGKLDCTHQSHTAQCMCGTNDLGARWDTVRSGDTERNPLRRREGGWTAGGTLRCHVDGDAVSDRWIGSFAALPECVPVALIEVGNARYIRTHQCSTPVASHRPPGAPVVGPVLEAAFGIPIDSTWDCCCRMIGGSPSSVVPVAASLPAQSH